MKRIRLRNRTYFKTVSVRKNVFEWYLTALACGILFIMLTAQIGLLMPEVRPELTDIEVYEGIDAAGELPQCSITLKAEPASSENAIVLVNGSPNGTFVNGMCEVAVLNRGLIEIDGRACKDGFSVLVDRITGEISGLAEGDTYHIGKSMAIIGRVEVLNK